MGRENSSRAVAPILISVIVLLVSIGGLIIAFSTSGFVGETMAMGFIGSERVVIVDAARCRMDNIVLVYCICISKDNVVIGGALLKDAEGKTLEAISLNTPVTLAALGSVEWIFCAFTENLEVGSAYYVVLLSKAGNQFASLSFRA